MTRRPPPLGVRYLSVPEAAGELGVSRRTIYRWVSLGKLPALTITPKVLRVEALTVVDGSVGPVDDLPEMVSARWFRRNLRVAEWALIQWIQQGLVPMRLVKVDGHLVRAMSRREFLRWCIDRTTGDRRTDAA